jgi:putative ABC transport system permease protein
LFAAAARLVLPRAFHREFAPELQTAFADQYRHALGQPRSAGMTRFWLREIGGLFATSGREYRDAVVAARRPRRRSRNQSPSPKRNRDMIGTFRKDLVYAFRMIVKTPVVSAIAVLSLALGVAANTTIFSIVNTWLLRPLPYPEADRLVMVWENDRNDSDDQDAVRYANFFDWREQATSFDSWIATDFGVANLTGLERPEQVTLANVTPNFFSLIGSDPMMGRTFLPDEGGTEDAPVAVLSETLWKNRFGAEADIIGKTMTLNDRTYTVVGVMPETFDFILGTVGLWIADDFESRRTNREDHQMLVTARLELGVSAAQAQNEMAAIGARLEEMYPETNTDYGVNVMTLREQFPGRTDRGLIQILMAVVFLVLLIACVNIASLLMAKTDARQKELAMRVALGAGKGRLVRQLLTESVVLALLAGALGVVLSFWGVAALVEAMPDQLPGSFTPRLDGTVLGFAIVASVLSGLTFGITPAMQAVSGNLRSALVDGSRGGTATRKKKRLRAAFVMAEFAMAFTILIGAAVLTDLFDRRLDIDPGFDVQNLLTMQLVLPEYKYGDEAEQVLFVDELERQLEGLPGASSYALANVLPRTRGLPFTEFTIDGQLDEENEEPETSWLTVNTTYFASLGIALRAGRSFTEADRAEAPLVVMVNQRMVERFFDGESPVGRRITIQDESREIVGVVNNIAQTRLAGLEPTFPAVYFPMAQRPARGMRMVLRAPGDPLVLAGAAQDAVWQVDSDQPIALVQTMDQHIEAELAGPTIMSQILFFVGFLALALAAIGIYGVMAYSVSQQTGEIGIRMALGAKPRQVLTRVTRQGATLAGMGLLLGVPLAALVVFFIGSVVSTASADGLQVSEASRVATVTPLVSVSLILAAVGLIACYLPARRATKIDPMVALTAE